MTLSKRSWLQFDESYLVISMAFWPLDHGLIWKNWKSRSWAVSCRLVRRRDLQCHPYIRVPRCLLFGRGKRKMSVYLRYMYPPPSTTKPPRSSSLRRAVWSTWCLRIFNSARAISPTLGHIVCALSTVNYGMHSSRRLSDTLIYVIQPPRLAEKYIACLRSLGVADILFAPCSCDKNDTPPCWRFIHHSFQSS